MPVKTLYPKPNAKRSGVNFMQMQDGGTAPANALTATGWTIGGAAVNNYSLTEALVERASTTFGTTVLPTSGGLNGTLGDAFSSELLTGEFVSGTWTLAFEMGTNIAEGQNGNIRLRVWKGPNANGSGATQLTTDSLAGTDVNFGLASSAEISGISSVSWAAPLIVMNSEYLFVQCAFHISDAVTEPTCDCVYVAGLNTKISTTDFKPSTSRNYVGMIGM